MNDHDLLIEMHTDIKYLMGSILDIKNHQKEYLKNCKENYDNNHSKIEKIEKISLKANTTGQILILIVLALIALVIEHALAYS